MNNALLIKPRVSILLCLFFCFLYVLSFLLFALSHMTLWMHFLLGAFLIAHFFYVMRRYVFYRHPLSITRLWCDERDHWKIQCRDTHVRIATLMQSAMISRYLVFLAFRVPGRFFPVTLPLALDSEHPESMRLLRQALLQTSVKPKKSAL